VPASKVAATHAPKSAKTPPPPPDATAPATPAESPVPQEPVTTSGKLTLEHTKRLFWVAATIAAGFLLFFTIVFVAGHSFIIQRWPQMQQIYVDLGLAQNPLKDNLVLTNITSERRYQDGAMQLVVQGEVQSHAKQRQVVPAISVEALGPDGRIIESWRIEPPKATMDPDTTVPFTSSIISPQGTVVEVNLSFVEPPHDEH